MFPSLRFRLLAMVAVVLAIALGAVALLSSRVFTVELQALVGGPGPRPPDLDVVAAGVAARLAAGDRAGASRFLAASAQRLGRGLLAVDAGGKVAAASEPLDTFVKVRVAAGGRRLTLVRQDRRGRADLQLLDPHRAALTTPTGEALGILFVMPRPASPAAAALRVPVERIRRTLLLAALAAGAAGLLLSFALARRILRPVEALTLAARRLEAGDLEQRVKVLGRDEIAGLARAFNAMADRRATAERLRRDLVHDVAHELRSPLTNLRGQLEALQDGLLTPSPQVLASLDEEVRWLERLVNDLQDLAMAEAGQLEMELAPLDLADAVNRGVKAFRPRFDEKELRVEIDVPANLPAVDADARRVAQILRNLLGNAAIHTPPGGRIRVAAAAAAGEVRVTVEDTGPGIPAVHLPFVFERFYRVDVSRSRATGGAGLGLAIVKQLAAAHGGRVWAESEAGRGARFGFSLPA